MEENRIEGVLFDKDGTLFDFNATWRGFVTDVLRTLAPGDVVLQRKLGAATGFDLDSGRFTPGSPIVAGSTGEIALGLAAHLHEWSAADIEAMCNQRAAAASDDGLVPAAGDIVALMDQMVRDGLTLGVATHDAEGAAYAHLRRAGIIDKFRFISGYDSGWGLKPGPGMLEGFSQITGVPAADTAVVGDSRHDLEMGRSGGAALCIGVLTGPAAADELAPFADHVIASIDDLPAVLAAHQAA